MYFTFLKVHITLTQLLNTIGMNMIMINVGFYTSQNQPHLPVAGILL